MRIGINGFGRIGRAIARINLEKEKFEIVAINDINPDINNMAYLLKYDSTYGRLKLPVEVNGNTISMNGNGNISIYHKEKIEEVPWEEHDVDIIIDCSGIKRNLGVYPDLKAKGIRHCVIANSPNGEDCDYRSIIMGVNEDTLTREDYLISSSICDANAFVPAMNLLDEHFGIDHGFVTTLHPWLGYQNLLDGPSLSVSDPGSIHSTYVLGRSSINAMIPKTTTCVSASSKVLPWIAERFLNLSYRVPTSIVSSADISVKLKNPVTRDDVINVFEEAEKNQTFNVFHNNDEALTSVDFTGFDCSAVVDHRWTMVNQDAYCKMILWYDNEWGYSCRVVDLVSYLDNI